MKILVLTQVLPFPPDAGPKVKTWNVLRYLVNCGHEVTLVSFIRKGEEAYKSVILAQGIRLKTIPIFRLRIKDLFYWGLSQLKQRPFLIQRDDLPEMRKVVEELIETEHFDAIHADQITMTQFVPIGDPKNGRQKPAITVFDAHNATYSIMERMRKNSAWYLRPALNLEVARIKRYEASLVKDFTYTLAVTNEDRELLIKNLQEIYGAGEPARHIPVIPITVDTTSIQAVSRPDHSLNIVTLGTLHYPPNADGIRWFIKEVFPKVVQQIPGVTLTVIGRNPPVDFYQLRDSSKGSISLTGYVPDLKPYLSQAAIMVVPVRAGSGMRVRILEALAWGIPIVTTHIGLEGIEARNNQDVLVGDSADEFAGEVIRLLEDEGLQKTLALNGRSLVEKVYDWQVALKGMDEIYPRA